MGGVLSRRRSLGGGDEAHTSSPGTHKVLDTQPIQRELSAVGYRRAFPEHTAARRLARRPTKRLMKYLVLIRGCSPLEPEDRGQGCRCALVVQDDQLHGPRAQVYEVRSNCLSSTHQQSQIDGVPLVNSGAEAEAESEASGTFTWYSSRALLWASALGPSSISVDPK